MRTLYVNDLGEEAHTALDRLAKRLDCSKANAVRTALVAFTPEVVDLIEDMKGFTPDVLAIALRLLNSRPEIEAARESIAALESRLQGGKD